MGKRKRYAPGTFCSVDLATTGPEGAKAFYAGLFSWETEAVQENGNLAYVAIENAASQNGGIRPMTEQHGDAPPYWLTYFTVP
jgi:predicted enzyme related to lactoylglutathione lyase